MHQWNMTCTACSCCFEPFLTLLWSLIVPIARVDIIGNDTVPQCFHRGQDVAASSKVWWTHISRLDPNDIHQGLVQSLHLLRQIIGGQGTEIARMRPRMRGDLMSRLVCILQSSFLAVDAPLGISISHVTS